MKDVIILGGPNGAGKTDRAYVYDNSDGASELIAERVGEANLVIHDPVRWAIIEGK